MAIKAKDGSVIPRSGVTTRLPPGTATPRSGLYEQVGPRGGRTGEQTDVMRGNPFPPTEGPGQTWELVQPAHHKRER